MRKGYRRCLSVSKLKCKKFSIRKNNSKNLERYFKGLERINNKYKTMMVNISNEEIIAIHLATKNYNDNELKKAIEEIKMEYEITKKLLKEQQLIEEKENLEIYKK